MHHTSTNSNYHTNTTRHHTGTNYTNYHFTTGTATNKTYYTTTTINAYTSLLVIRLIL